MYLSHPVRRMRDDPMDDQDVTLVVSAADDADVDALEEAIEAAGGAVEEHLEFGALSVRIEELDVTPLCDVDGIDSIETANTRGYAGDAGEDI
jgi:small-conductance mechanosensitive channel